MLISGAAALLLTGSAVYAADCNPCTTDPDAVTLECDNTGDYLIAPLYYAVGPWQTQLKVVNTNSERAIVARVILRDGTDCTEFLDFNIYLTPGDVWTGTIYNENGVIKVKSDDDSFIIGGKQGAEVGSIGNAPETVGHRDLRIGYVEIAGLVSLDPDLIDNDKKDGSWTACKPLDKMTFYKRVRGERQLKIEGLDPQDVGNDDLTGRVTIITDNPQDVNSARYMTLNMTAFGNFATTPRAPFYGPNTQLTEITEKGYRVLPEMDAALAKAAVNILYEGNGEEVLPIRAHFTLPTKKYWYVSGAPMPTAYKLSDLYGDGLDNDAPSEYYYSVNPTGAEVQSRDNSENCNLCKKRSELSGYGAKQETCEIKIHSEVAYFDNSSPIVQDLAFASGGWVNIDLTNNDYRGSVGGKDVAFKGMPGIATSFVAREFNINGQSIYLNNWLYDSYKAAECE
jgi:hypothetical protein